MKTGKIMVLVLGLALGICGRSAVITVDDDGPADFSTIQAAVNAAQPNDTVIILPGTYTGAGNRDIDFLGKAITVQSVNPYDPDIVETTIVDCQGSQADRHRGFYFHNNETNASVLKGLTVINGYVDGSYWYQQSGGAVLCDHASPMISYCRFIQNKAREGGGLFFWGSTTTLSYCQIEGNESNSLTHGIGGGVYSRESNLLLEYCVISGNKAPGAAAGAFDEGIADFKDCIIEANQNGGISGKTINLDNCVIRDNIGIDSYYGAGTGVNLAYGTVKNCIFEGNYTETLGGGLRAVGCGIAPDPLIINCTFTNNTAVQRAGAAASVGGSGCDPVFKHCIVWDNQPEDDPGIAAYTTSKCGLPTARIQLSILQYDWASFRLTVENSLVADPLFADPNNGGFHLKSQGGRWDSQQQQWILDTVTSPGVDGGDPSMPVGDEVYPHGDIINLGAYGGTAEASRTYVPGADCLSINAPYFGDWVRFGIPDCWCYEHNCYGDADGRLFGTTKSAYRQVYIDDLNILTLAYNIPEPPKGQGIANLIIDGFPAICADFARDQEGTTKTGFKRVYLHDLNILTSSYAISEPAKGPGIPSCPLTTAGGDIVYYKYPE